MDDGISASCIFTRTTVAGVAAAAAAVAVADSTAEQTVDTFVVHHFPHFIM